SLESVGFVWLLILIAILSGACAWYGMRVLPFQRRSERHHIKLDYVFPSLLSLLGVGIRIYGFAIDFPLLKYFPILGIFLGSIHLIYCFSRPNLKMNWMMEHIDGMMLCFIA